MTYQLFKKLPIAIAGAASVLGFINPLPATAATFSFDLEGAWINYFGYDPIDTCETRTCGSGELTFDDASLTGAAYEEVTLSNLINSKFSFSWFDLYAEDAGASFAELVGTVTYPFEVYYEADDWDPIFQFQNGILTGMRFNILGILAYDAGWGFWNPYKYLAFRGNTWDWNQKSETEAAGYIEFTVVEAWSGNSNQPVPEPTSVAALGIVGTGLLLKRKKIEKA